ncbi:hypothetical protein [Variovorax terrae]|uniref:Uncharacterized protein n=1 Tax=Variovorax terrae TaxID=2923278 RepID=A0A9X1VSE4_9BURK|nr:hypothetical protein [Variovorax terrae]MCJ0762520.1 hypothetical protein [Variovorax terrae]
MPEIACAGPDAQSLLAWVAAVKQGLTPSQGIVTLRLDQMRLEDLVLSLLDLDIEEAAQVDSLADSASPFERCPERFHETLQKAIWQSPLCKLFARTHDGEYHRSLCPAAYNERTGEHHAEEMARWRADFRAMPPEQQMMAATIVWMYRSGPDSIWLRRVPCTWKASEALHYMHDTGCLALWLQLIARYPGW